jgi:hypothetical protein
MVPTAVHGREEASSRLRLVADRKPDLLGSPVLRSLE